MIQPYYQEDGIKLYVGDCREIIPVLEEDFTSVITDPVWPNVPEGMFPYVDDPYTLLREVASLLIGKTIRIIIQMGCNSDPRFLTAIPDLKFFRSHWLEYNKPSYSGRVMNGNDVAYVFGPPPASKPGARVIPGRFINKENTSKRNGHPCPRRLSHTQYLIKWYAEKGPILDPFVGSGTTLLAAKIMGVPAVGIEINQEYADIAIKRLKAKHILKFNHV